MYVCMYKCISYSYVYHPVLSLLYSNLLMFQNHFRKAEFINTIEALGFAAGLNSFRMLMEHQPTDR